MSNNTDIQKRLKVIDATLSFLAERIPESTNKNFNLTKQYWKYIEFIKQDRQLAINISSEYLEHGTHAFERFFGATLLGQVYNPAEKSEHKEAEVAIALLSKAADSEQDVRVLEVIGYALGYFGLIQARPAILKLATHPNADVRYSATQSFSSILQERPPKRVLKILMSLMQDKDPDIRDWATFTLGTQAFIEEVDSEEVRQALFERIHDRHLDTASEAFMGLAYRNDKRGIIPLRTMLLKRLQTGKNISRINIEAAGTYGTPELLPALTEIATWWKDESGLLAWALKRCDPKESVRKSVPREWNDLV